MLKLNGIRVTLGSRPILNGVDLAVPEGSFTVLCGMPGNGKSVLARVICGLEQPDAGTVELNGTDLTSQPPGKRAIGYVPQSFALFPHYSVGANIGYPLKVSRWDKDESTRRVEKVARMLRVQDLLSKRVDQISGGQKQRVALARGLIKENSLYVLDDPLAGLDFKLREQLTQDLRNLQREIGSTFVYLTSDPLETLALADYVCVLAEGRIAESSSMPGAYLDPGHIDTALALGFPRANRLSRRLMGAIPHSRLEGDEDLTGRSTVDALVRPEHISLVGHPDAIRIDAELMLIEDLGGESVVYLQPPEDADLVVATVGSDDPVLHEDITAFWFSPESVMLFDRSTGARIRSTT